MTEQLPNGRRPHAPPEGLPGVATGSGMEPPPQNGSTTSGRVPLPLKGNKALVALFAQQIEMVALLVERGKRNLCFFNDTLRNVWLRSSGSST